MSLIVFNFESNKDSQVLAFTLDWVNEIAKNVDKLYVVSLRCGEYKVNNNVEVYCLKQNKKNKVQTIISIWKTLRIIHKKDKDINGYFVHMAHYFVPFIYPFAKFYKQKIVLWYAHKSVPWTLRLSEILADKIFSISTMSMRLKTKKFQAIGHGIDTTNRFKLKEEFRDTIKNIVVVGRISKVKNTYIIVESFIKLGRDDIFLHIVGDTLSDDDKKYLNVIKSIIPEYLINNIIFTGVINFDKMTEIYNNADLAINLGDGALDKAIIEPMAIGIPIITSNETSIELFGHLNAKGVYLLKEKKELYMLLKEVLEENVKFDKRIVRNEIVKNHSLFKLAKKIVNEFNTF